jgi:hypothetical protein
MRECGLTCQRMDELCNFGTGYTGKLLGGAQAKGVGMMGFLALTETLGITAVFVVNPELTERMREHWSAPVDNRVRAKRFANLGAAAIKRVTPTICRHLGSAGGKSRAAKLSPEERRESARKAARARWRKVTQKARGKLMQAAAKARWARPRGTDSIAAQEISTVSSSDHGALP